MPDKNNAGGDYIGIQGFWGNKKTCEAMASIVANYIVIFENCSMMSIRR